MSEVDPEQVQYEGGCACGAVRYRVDGAPIYANNCHCTLCQRQSGTGSVFNGLYESDRVTLLSGELTGHRVQTGSGKVQDIRRCALCGTAVWSHYPRLGHAGTAIRMGTLDEAAAFRPDAAIFVTTRLPWVALSDSVPQFEEGYDFGAVLLPDRLERFRVLAARVASSEARPA